MKVVASLLDPDRTPPRQRQRQNHTRESHAQTKTGTVPHHAVKSGGIMSDVSPLECETTLKN